MSQTTKPRRARKGRRSRRLGAFVIGIAVLAAAIVAPAVASNNAGVETYSLFGDMKSELSEQGMPEEARVLDGMERAIATNFGGYLSGMQNEEITVPEEELLANNLDTAILKTGLGLARPRDRMVRGSAMMSPVAVWAQNQIQYRADVTYVRYSVLAGIELAITTPIATVGAMTGEVDDEGNAVWQGIGICAKPDPEGDKFTDFLIDPMCKYRVEISGEKTELFPFIGYGHRLDVTAWPSFTDSKISFNGKLLPINTVEITAQGE